MVVGIASTEALSGPIRPFDARRDLRALADLIEVGFGPELATTGSRMVQDLREMAQWGAALRVAGSLPGFLSGYVWEDNGRTVGNVTMTREKQPNTWALSNIVVAPSHQGRGIAGALVDTAIDRIRRQGGKTILLQVRSDHDVAQAIYLHRGFKHFDTLHEVQLSYRHWPTIVGTRQRRLRPVRLWEGAALYRLVVDSMPAEAARLKPPVPGRYQRGLLYQMSQMFQMVMSGEEVIERLISDEQGLCAYVGLRAHLWRGPHELELATLPAHRGRWERFLLNEVFRLISHLPRQNVRAYVSSDHPETLTAFADYGFELLRVLDQMALEID